MNGTTEIAQDNIPSSSVPIPETEKPNRLNPRGLGGGRRPWWQDAVTREKYNAFKLLRNEGFSTTKAAEAIGYAPSYGEVIDGKIKEFEARKAASGASVGFLTSKRITRAGAVVDKFMQGKVFGDIKEIKDSTVLRAAETVLDRSHPKRSDSDDRPNVSFVTVNLGFMGIQDDPVPAPVDITPADEYLDPGVLGDGI